MSDPIGAFLLTVTGRIIAAKKAAALDLWNRLTLKTPRDTGRASANWNVAIGAADLSVSDPTEGPGSHALPRPPLDQLSAVGIGDSVWVTNNLPYIEALNDGHSSQTPSGFVEQSINETIHAFEGIVQRVKR